MTYPEKIEKQLEKKGIKKSWLAHALGLRYTQFWEKMKQNKFSEEEKEKVVILLGEDSPEKTAILKNTNLKNSLKTVLKNLK